MKNTKEDRCQCWKGCTAPRQNVVEDTLDTGETPDNTHKESDNCDLIEVAGKIIGCRNTHKNCPYMK